jgi:hypothetical protein
MTLLASATAGMLDSARHFLAEPAAWPDPPSGFASRLLQAAEILPPPAFAEPFRPAGAQILRRAPDLAAFGYVIEQASADTQADWAQAFERLRGREIFPPDRNGFIHSPLELVGIAFGLRDHPQVDDSQRRWLGDAIRLGFATGEFLTPVARASAVAAARLLGRADTPVETENLASKLMEMPLPDLLLLGALALLAPNGAAIDLSAAENALAMRVLAEPVAVRDTADAASVLVLLQRAVSRAGVATSDDPAARVVGVCRRFPLFVERLKSRQRSRPALEVKDEYDVQDLLHAILKLHFDDVRPEEWTPSYAGNASRVDFLLPGERILIEAKMTRANMGQREVVDQLTIDRARYEMAPNVDHLVCLVYDPIRRCTNPTAIESDLARTDGRLRVTVVVCPRGA